MAIDTFEVELGTPVVKIREMKVVVPLVLDGVEKEMELGFSEVDLEI